MNALFIILTLAGVICFVLEAARVPTRVGLLGLGLALVFTVPLIQFIRRA